MVKKLDSVFSYPHVSSLGKARKYTVWYIKSKKIKEKYFSITFSIFTIHNKKKT